MSIVVIILAILYLNGIPCGRSLAICSIILSVVSFILAACERAKR